MPSLYFCESENQSHGVLRAVVSWDVCHRVVKQESAIYLGEKFPDKPIEGARPSIVPILYVRPEEASERWRAGFYRIDTDVFEIDKTLQAIVEPLPNMHRVRAALARD